MISHEWDGAVDQLHPNSLILAFAWVEPAGLTPPLPPGSVGKIQTPYENPQVATDYFKGKCLPHSICS